MGSQHRLSLHTTGPGVAHFRPKDIVQMKAALQGPPDEAGQTISAKILLSVLAATNPFFATIISAISILAIIQKILHYAEIAEKEGIDAAVLAIITDIGTGAIRQYVTDATIDSLVDSGSISPELRSLLEEIIGTVVDQGIDQVEEAFLNE